jgi:hypothetical protein
MPLPDSVRAPGRPDTTALAPVRDTLAADSVVLAGAPTDSLRAAGAATADSGAVDSVFLPRTRPPSRHWRATRRLRTRLRTEAYAEPALVPASPWLDDDPPGRPRLAARRTDRGVEVTLTPANRGPRWWLVRWRRDGTWATDVVPGARRTYTVPDRPAPVAVVVSAVDATGNVGPPAGGLLDALTPPSEAD